MPKPLASLSLDLDNQWSYMKTHGDPGWEELPSYLDLVVPRVLKFLRQRAMRITFFIVGQDAALEKNAEPLASIARDGHEIGNHSFHHEPWLHLYSAQQVDDEIACAEEAIEQATARRPIGFRGPGYSSSDAVTQALARRGYLYDASSLPTFIGPLARAYYFMTAKLTEEERRRRKALFGSWKDGLKPLRPYILQPNGTPLVELPVTTMPGLRLPIHVSYLLYLSRFSPALARLYAATAVRTCSIAGVEPSLLLHPLDFLGCDDVAALRFFPAMDVPACEKILLVGEVLETFGKTFQWITLEQHARHVLARAAGAGKRHAPA